MLISKYNFVLNCTLKNWKYTIFFRWFLRTCQHHLAYKQKLEFQRGFSINKGLRRYLVKTLTISRRGWCHKRKFTLKLKGYLKLFQFFFTLPNSIFLSYSNLQIFLRDSIFILNQTFTFKQLVDVKYLIVQKIRSLTSVSEFFGCFG